VKNEQLIYKAVADVAVANRSAMTGRTAPLGEETQKIDLKQFAMELCDAFEAIEKREPVK
jgi:hypothetical protein